MFINKLRAALFAVMALVAGSVATSASAAPLTGAFAFFGGVAQGQNLLTTNSLDFNGPFTVSIAPGPTGSFAGLTAGTIKDFTFSPFSAVQDFLTFVGTTLNFDLLNVVNVTRGTLPGGSFLTISGSGRFQMAGFDDTPGIITLSLQDLGGAGIDISFSASAMSVPEPASAALLGAALAGLVLLRRARRVA